MFSVMQDAGLFLLAAPPAGGESGAASMTQTFVFMGLIFVVFWFFMIRPQRQKQKQREAMLKALDKGDKVVTIGGIRGTVAKVTEDVVAVKIDNNCKIDFNRSAISEVVRQEGNSTEGEALSLNKEVADKKNSEKNKKQDKGEEGAQ